MPTDWKGLDLAEIWTVALEICPPIKRRKWQQEPTSRSSPLGVVGRMLQSAIKAMPSGKRPTNTQLARVLRPQAPKQKLPFVGTMLDGNDGRDPVEQDFWNEYSLLLRAFLLGIPVPDPLSMNDPKHRVVHRIEDYLFGSVRAGCPAHFRPEVLASDSPRRPEEAVYQILWFANEKSRDAHAVARTFMVSGKEKFLLLKPDSSVDETGEALALAIVAGVEVCFVFPDNTIAGNRPIHKFVDDFRKSLKAYLSKKTFADFFSALPAIRDAAQGLDNDAIDNAVRAKVRDVPLDPTIVKSISKQVVQDAFPWRSAPEDCEGTKLIAGQWFQPGRQCIFSQHIRERKVIFERLFHLWPGGAAPFAESTASEQEEFMFWLATFVLSQASVSSSQTN